MKALPHIGSNVGHFGGHARRPLVRGWLAGLLTLGLLLPVGAALAEEGNQEGRAPSRALIFRVTDSEDNELWLLGSIHLADESIYPLPDVVEEAWSDSKVLAVEADVVTADPAALQQQMMSAALDPSGRRLSERLPDDLYKETAGRLKELGMEIAMLEPMRPWFVAMLISSLAIQKAGLSPEHGIEHHFIERAGEREVVELEGAARQLDIFSSLSDDLEILLLRHSLADTKDLEDELKKMLDAWRTADIEALTKLRTSITREDPDLAPIDHILFTVRNREMTEKIAEYLEGETQHFVVVGAAHLVGEKSIVSMLKERGYTVERR